jgi:hypothetical protein|mmetsp:Transcript_33515/g.53329  ORF Transcript_33515/g.53329 Transcript_33515/m.53329 type:complete len:353 (+) Transcript_33515:51-1109(+)|eukprot:CAMPEP_0169131326 /NCGR_PEP_ID=MMETSP1015-20121227/38189_1 /TAXON_ID=342587 /ORGANISM="Karlodinium micrum, Strain CCMP2283" /LENGTH=352 /DNA_ID=CAMNT_0009195583 /DNA_START=51 /DNA_END=1109 /DNA_ORIENTATION=+
MGRKVQNPPEEKKVEKPEEEDEEEDTPIVKTLKEIDVRFCKLEVEYEKEEAAIRKKYDALQAPLLAERAAALADASNAEDKTTGTPACKGFWLQAMNNGDIAETIETYDEPVLEYLKDIKYSDTGDDPKAGGKLEYIFAENPYFTNETLSIEWVSDYDPEKYTPWQECEIVDWKGSTVDWKPGKDVTVELIAKKTKGGGAKKAKQKAKSKEEPRNSFFRLLFRTLKKGDAAPEDLAGIFGFGDDEGEDDSAVDMVLEQLGGFAQETKEIVIKYGIRLYTGEIAPDDDDSDDEDEEEESEDGDEEISDDDDDDEEDPPKGKGKEKAKKKPAKAGANPAGGKGDGKGQEECKQQ